MRAGIMLIFLSALCLVAGIEWPWHSMCGCWMDTTIIFWKFGYLKIYNVVMGNYDLMHGKTPRKYFEFPKTATTKFCNYIALNNIHFRVSQFWRPGVWDQDVTGLVPSEDYEEASVQASCLVQGGWRQNLEFLDLWNIIPIFAFIFTYHSPCVCVCVCLRFPVFYTNTSPIELESTLLQCDLRYFIYSSPIFK